MYSFVARGDGRWRQGEVKQDKLALTTDNRELENQVRGAEYLVGWDAVIQFKVGRTGTWEERAVLGEGGREYTLSLDEVS